MKPATYLMYKNWSAKELNIYKNKKNKKTKNKKHPTPPTLGSPKELNIYNSTVSLTPLCTFSNEEGKIGTCYLFLQSNTQSNFVYEYYQFCVDIGFIIIW